jgi:hypothetical protein
MSNIIKAYNTLKVADFTIVNQGTKTITDIGNKISITGPSTSGYSWCFLTKSLPTAPYIVETYVENLSVWSSYLMQGLALYDSASGKSVTYSIRTNGAVYNCILIVDTNSSVTTHVASIYSNGAENWGINWLRIVDDNTNWKFQASTDGINWVTQYSTARNTYCTPNTVGLSVCAYDKALATTFSHFKVITSG